MPNQEEKSKNVPHSAVVFIKAEIMEQLPSGEVSGLPKKIEKKHIFINGDSLEEVHAKVKDFMKGLENGKK